MRCRVVLGLIVAVAGGLVLTTGTGTQRVDLAGTAASAQAAPGLKTPAPAIRWYRNDMRAFAEARRRKLGVMVEFTARWCAPCVKLRAVFNQPAVRNVIARRFVAVRFDVTAGNTADEYHQNLYGARTLPTVLFLDPRAVDPNKLDSAALRKAELGRIRRFVTAKQLLATLPARPGSGKRKRH